MTQYTNKANEFIKDVDAINQFVNGDTETVVTLPNGQTVASMRKMAADTVSYLNDPGNHYTKNEIDAGDIVLNAIKNVDGDGSGLDADLIRGLPADFTASLNTNGYTKLPNGLIIQWGTWTGVTPEDDTKTRVSFPISFPNNVLNLNLTSKNNANGGIEGIENTVAIEDMDLSGFYFMKHRISGSGDGTEHLDVNWLALGY